MGAAMGSAKSRRINLRASPDQEGLLRSVAQRKGQTMTEFIIQSACAAAEREFADEKEFRLSPEKWHAFVEALERPAQVHPRLLRLFAQSSVLEPTHTSQGRRDR
jgi:uncharacterized protein (DUF1778 family)